MKKVALCIRCTHGQFFNMLIDERVALQLVKAWIDGNLPLTKTGILTGQCLPDVSIWAIKASEIVLMHTQEMNAGQIPAIQPTPWAGPHGSGI